MSAPSANFSLPASVTNAWNSMNAKISNLCDKGAIPLNTFENTKKAFAIGSIMAFIYTKNDFDYSLKMGAFCAAATILHGVITPLFKIFFKTPTFNQYVEMGRGTAALTGAAFFATKCLKMPMSLNELIGQVAFYALRLYLSNGEMQHSTQSNIMALVFTVRA